MFDSWLGRANNTVYTALEDGMVHAIASGEGVDLIGLTDGANPPTTIRQRATPAAQDYVSISFGVRRGDYWKVTGATTVYLLMFKPL